MRIPNATFISSHSNASKSATTTTTTSSSSSSHQPLLPTPNHHHHHPSAAPPPRRGLFSIPELQHPRDFLQLASTAMAEGDALRALVRRDHAATTTTDPSTNLTQARTLLFRLDRISQTVCNVIDAAELCRSVHADPHWREAAHQAFGVVADYIAQLNSDADLYHALVEQVTRHRTTILNQLSQEEVRLAILLQQEFERDGIHLPEAQRAMVRTMVGHVTELESLFQRNLVQFQRTLTVPASTVHSVLSPSILESVGVTREQYNHDKDTVTVPHDAQVLQSLLKYSHSSSLRRDVYMELYTAVPDNLSVLQSLVQQRQALAHALGYPSYADRFLRDKMAQNPTTVQTFLQTLLQRTKPYFQHELHVIAQAKQRMEGTTAAAAVVEPWDIPFYVDLLKGRDGFDSHRMISPYLTLDGCLRGMQQLVQALFGMDMTEEEMTEDERWDGPPDGTRNHSSRGIRRFTFVEQANGNPLGTMYLDLHPRPGKYGHAAHFTVRCGCVKNEPDEPVPQYQLPIIALVCNLTGGGGNGSADASSPCILSHSETETLFHEFGHALHSLLSRTKFQHMSGTRAAMDFVETPSHLLEHFVWDPQFLKILAAHYQTGQAMPEELIEQLRRSRYEFSALERQNQIIYAWFDQLLFGTSPLQNASGKVDTTALFAQLNRENGIPYADGTHWHTQFGHLVTYGAGYYGYLYAQVFAGDIWRTLFEGQSLSRSSGERLWHGLLRHGGAKDPHEMLTDVLGREPMVDWFSDEQQR